MMPPIGRDAALGAVVLDRQQAVTNASRRLRSLRTCLYHVRTASRVSLLYAQVFDA